MGALTERVAALYVLPRGCYAGLPDVDLWDEARDARTYPGPYPVVAHPPCSRWCRLAGLVEKRWGHKRGDDGGCFAAALAAVNRWGGVLEHPAYSDAWDAFGLHRPCPGGGWTRSVLGGGWTCHIEQLRYGHRARKATWLYAVDCELPSLLWGYQPDTAWKARRGKHAVGWRDSRQRRKAPALVSKCRNHTPATDARPRLTKREALATPQAFRDLLLGMARSVYNVRGMQT